MSVFLKNIRRPSAARKGDLLMEKEKLKYEKSLAKITFVKQAYEIEAMQQVIIAMRSIVGTKFDDKCRAAYAALDTARHELLEATHIDG